MAQIKTKLRNCMNIETLGALMMISSNGPKLSDKEAILKLIEEAFAHWLARQKRCLARSHPGSWREEASTQRNRRGRKRCRFTSSCSHKRVRFVMHGQSSIHSSADESEGEESNGRWKQCGGYWRR
jgi:hypothetical protein